MRHPTKAEKERVRNWQGINTFGLHAHMITLITCFIRCYSYACHGVAPSGSPLNRPQWAFFGCVRSALCVKKQLMCRRRNLAVSSVRHMANRRAEWSFLRSARTLSSGRLPGKYGDRGRQTAMTPVLTRSDLLDEMPPRSPPRRERIRARGLRAS